MSIKTDVMELEAIRAELKTLSFRRKKLREKEQAVEQRIQDYLRSKEQPGLKHNGTAILLEEKEKRTTKKAKDRDRDAASVLEQYGIRDSERVLKEIMEARKGDPIPSAKLKIKKYKGDKY